SGAVF
ncbi:SUR7-like protein, partial [Saccharomyces kudriavzevii IFO 1802]